MSQENKPYIKVSDLTLKTPLGPVYTNVSFSAEKGQTICVFGTAGSGKTSLLLTLCGRMKPSSGQGSIAGYDLIKTRKKIRLISNISLVERVNDIPENLPIRKVLSAELQLEGKSGRRAKVTEYFQRWNFEGEQDKNYQSLSPYDKVLFGIMLACAGDPELLAVDDIQEGLTQHESIKLVKLFKKLAEEQGITVVFACGEYDIACYADGVVVTTDEAEGQRQAVLRDKGANYDVAVVGSGNGVMPAASPARANKESEVA